MDKNDLLVVKLEEEAKTTEKKEDNIYYKAAPDAKNAPTCPGMYHILYAQ